MAPNAPSGYVVSNLDPNLNSTLNNQIYDPNFIPGFEVGLANTSIYWRSGVGYAKIGYSIGPWVHDRKGLPHLAVGPQCCNFEEVPRTQQFRRVDWGDYYYVRAGFGPPGVNVENYTTDFKAPAHVGLRTDWNWTVRLSLNWSSPILLNQNNEWAAVGIAVTQYVPNAPDKLVYTVVNFWMDRNSSSSVTSSPDGIARMVGPPNLVVYHPVQISGEGNRTITIDISPYLSDTLHALGLSSLKSQPPVISYVYLNVQGYNFRWNTTLSSLMIMTPNNSPVAPALTTFYLAAVLIVVSISGLLLYRFRSKWRSPPTH